MSTCEYHSSMLPYTDTTGLNHEYMWVSQQNITLQRDYWAEPWVHVSITPVCNLTQRLFGWTMSTCEYHNNILPYTETIGLKHEYMYISHQNITLHREYWAETWVHVSITTAYYLTQIIFGWTISTCEYHTSVLPYEETIGLKHEYMRVSQRHITLLR